MLTLLVKWIVYAGAVFIVGMFLPGIHVGGFLTALLVALAFGIINVTIGPLLRLLTFPITIITLGIFSLILNTFLFWSTTIFVPGFRIDGFWWAMAGAVIVSIVSSLGNHLILGPDGKVGEG